MASSRSTVPDRLSRLTVWLPSLPPRTRRIVTLLSAVTVSLSAGTNCASQMPLPRLLARSEVPGQTSSRPILPSWRTGCTSPRRP